MKVKICGITRVEDALGAARFGADALGFNFWPRSKRFLPPRDAGRIVRSLPPFVTAVGVFVNPTRDEVLAAIDQARISVAQLHGDEPPDFCASLPVPVVKAIRVKDAHDLAALASYEVSGFLLDAPTPGYGGSGETFDWSLAAAAAAELPVLLAGGLTPANVADAVRAVRPWGVDVASGVECQQPGVKDLALVARFIQNAKEAAR